MTEPERSAAWLAIPRAKKRTKDALVAAGVRPEEIAARLAQDEIFTEEEAQAWLAKLREPRIPAAPVEVVIREAKQHRKMVQKRLETAAEHNRRVFAEIQERNCGEQLTQYQIILNYWAEERFAAEQEERRLRGADPMCLYHRAEPFHGE
jgi:hypothetical protein